VSDSVLQLEALSPEALKGQLEAIPKSSKLENKFVVLSVPSKQAIVRNFELPVLSAKELRSALAIQAVEVFSLHPEEIEIDYQVLSNKGAKSRGFFLAMSKSAVKDYYRLVAKSGLIPFVLTSRMLMVINSILTRVPSSAKMSYILSFTGEKGAFLALFNEGECELLRDISYDDTAEAKQEISNSLRYVLGKSAVKHPPELYLCGDIAGKEELITGLENEFNFKAKLVELSTPGFNDADGYFKLNLFKEYTVSLSSRRKLHYFANIALIAVSLVFIMVCAGNLKLGGQIRALKKDADPAKKAAEYGNRIKDLQVQIKSLENEK
jgi:hypothetical protein